jgi:hypothetical protein
MSTANDVLGQLAARGDAAAPTVGLRGRGHADFSAAAGTAASADTTAGWWRPSTKHRPRAGYLGFDARAMETWTLMTGQTPLFSAPRVAVIRSFLFNHWYHHRGQLVVYLRLLDVPVPSVYGPSADENPFGPAH